MKYNRRTDFQKMNSVASRREVVRIRLHPAWARVLDAFAEANHGGDTSAMVLALLKEHYAKNRIHR